jgi:hypothetical protein
MVIVVLDSISLGFAAPQFYPQFGPRELASFIELLRATRKRKMR